MTGPFVQTQRLSLATFVALIALCVIALATALIPGLPAGARLAALAACGLVLLLYFEIQRLTIVVTRDELVAGFKHLRSRTRIDEIEGARPVRAGFWTHGVGAHLSTRGQVAIVARTGPGILVARKGRRALVFSSDDPGAVLGALKAAGAAGVVTDAAGAAA